MTHGYPLSMQLPITCILNMEFFLFNESDFYVHQSLDIYSIYVYFYDTYIYAYFCIYNQECNTIHIVAYGQIQRYVYFLYLTHYHLDGIKSLACNNMQDMT